jgi:hypothetical protein
MRKVRYAALLLVLAAPAVPRQAPAQPADGVRQLMIDKLKFAQRLLEGIVTNDFRKINGSAEELIRISKTAEWYVRRTPRYEVHSNEFRRAAEDIIRSAQAKNLDGVTLAYVDLTLTCVRCHRYAREVRDARLPPGRGTPALALAGAK